MKKGMQVTINSEAVSDSNLPSNIGTIKRLFNEVGVGVPDYEFAEIEFADGSSGVVGQHEISLKRFKVPKETIEFLEGLVHKRFSLDGLNKTLSEFFEEDIKVYNASQGRIDSGEDDDELTDFNLMFNIEGFANPSAGYFDIYMLPMRREGFDGATMYITEVSYEFN